MKLFLAKGAKTDPKDNRGMTALMFAAWDNHTESLKSLLEKGSDLEQGADVSARDGGGQTALFKASAKGHAEIAQVLLARGADLSVQDNNGKDCPGHRSRSAPGRNRSSLKGRGFAAINAGTSM